MIMPQAVISQLEALCSQHELDISNVLTQVISCPSSRLKSLYASLTRSEVKTLENVKTFTDAEVFRVNGAVEETDGTLFSLMDKHFVAVCKLQDQKFICVSYGTANLKLGKGNTPALKLGLFFDDRERLVYVIPQVPKMMFMSAHRSDTSLAVNADGHSVTVEVVKLWQPCQSEVPIQAMLAVLMQLEKYYATGAASHMQPYKSDSGTELIDPLNKHKSPVEHKRSAFIRTCRSGKKTCVRETIVNRREIADASSR